MTTEKKKVSPGPRTRGETGRVPSGLLGWLRRRSRRARRRLAGNTRAWALCSRPGLNGWAPLRLPRATSSNSSSSPRSSRTRGSKHLDVIRARLRLSPPIFPERWTCSPPLWARSMSRFPAVAGRAPRRQEEGERSISQGRLRDSGLKQTED